jgi:HAD superfamily hydrolase (TIGR01509 family)
VAPPGAHAPAAFVRAVEVTLRTRLVALQVGRPAGQADLRRRCAGLFQRCSAILALSVLKGNWQSFEGVCVGRYSLTQSKAVNSCFRYRQSSLTAVAAGTSLARLATGGRFATDRPASPPRGRAVKGIHAEKYTRRCVALQYRPSVQMYSTLIFDLSEVLISGLTGVEKTLAPRLELPEKEIFEAMFAPPTHEFFEGKVTEKHWLEQLIQKNAWVGVSAEELAQIVRRNFDRPVDGTEAMVRQLAGSYELALLSDHAREWVDYLRPRHAFFSAFPHQFFSFELGHTKRESIAFSMVLERLNKTGDDCLFVDDLESNLRVARSVGIQGILFKDARQAAAELRRLGITVD